MMIMATKVSNSYQEKPFPPLRRTIVDFVELAKQKHTVYALTQADVTEARIRLKEHLAKTGEKISFTAFIITCYAHLIGEKYKYPLNTYRKRKKKLYIFNEVDVACIIERDINGKKIPTNYTVRNANSKSLREIHDEIRKAQKGRKDRITTGQKNKGIANKIHVLPSFLRRKLFRYVLNNPTKKKAMNGTVGMTAVGMLGSGSGYMVNMTPHTLSCGVGGMDKHPIVIDDEIHIREMLSLTLGFDHDVVDGGPAARFSSDIRIMLAHDCLDASWCFASL